MPWRAQGSGRQHRHICGRCGGGGGACPGPWHAVFKATRPMAAMWPGRALLNAVAACSYPGTRTVKRSYDEKAKARC